MDMDQGSADNGLNKISASGKTFMLYQSV